MQKNLKTAIASIAYEFVMSKGDYGLPGIRGLRVSLSVHVSIHSIAWTRSCVLCAYTFRVTKADWEQPVPK